MAKTAGFHRSQIDSGRANSRHCHQTVHASEHKLEHKLVHDFRYSNSVEFSAIQRPNGVGCQLAAADTKTTPLKPRRFFRKPPVTMHATDYLAKHKTLSDTPILVLFGGERFLKLEILKLIPGCGDHGADGSNEDDVTFTRTAGKDAELRSVSDELQTLSMFGDKRIVMIEDADDFVSANRPGLEKYAAKPSTSSMLILDVKSWPKNTKLFKAVEKIGLNIECGELKGAALAKWLVKTAKEQHGKSINSNTAALIVQLAGDSLGLLQQELEKLVSLVGDVDTITDEDVTRVVGGWRIETTWAMLDAVRDGHVGKAIECLDKLLMSGDAPQKILGGVTFTFRKLADATEIARQTRDVSGALRSAGIFPQAIAASEQYLRRIGFDKASQILQLLVQADANMKGGSRVDARLQLEALFVNLAT